MATEPLIVQAIYAFKGTNNDELCFKKGDKITVTQREDGGWWEGTLGEKTGWFPSNYVKEFIDGASPAASPIRPSVDFSQQRQYRAVVLKDLIDSEKAHIAELHGLVSNFLQPLEKSDILNRDEYRQLTGNLMEVLDTHVKLLSLIEECVSRPSNEQRVGKLFLHWAPHIKTVHQTYCALHPKAVCILDKYKNELTAFMEKAGAASPGLLVLTTGLSKPFRRLDKYPGMLQELERHVEESHPDRGDTQRSVAVYKELASTCAATRRQKELELQVLTGPVRGWEGQSLSQLGDILHMGSVAVGPQHHDRYLVLFPTTLLVLSVSQRMSAFIYEGKLPLTGITVSKLEDTETYKNAFDIAGPLIERIVAVCQSRDEAQAWVDLLLKHTQTRVMSKVGPPNEASNDSPHPPPHMDTRGYERRASILKYSCKPPRPYKVTYPPASHPSASPYAHLTKHYSRLVRHKLITRHTLKTLLYPQYVDLRKVDLSHVRMRRHRSEFIIVKSSSNEWQKVSVLVVSSGSDTDSSDSDSSSSDDSSSCGEEEPCKSAALARQNAVDKRSDATTSNASTCSSNPFGFIRYYNPDFNMDESSTYQSESFVDHGIQALTPEGQKLCNTHATTAKVLLAVINQSSGNTDNSSFECDVKPYMACEDLLNMDESLKIAPMAPLEPIHQSKSVPQERQSCPTKFVANKFNKCSLTTINVPNWQSNSEDNLSTTKHKRESKSDSSCSTPSHSSTLNLPILPVNTLPAPDSLVAELLYNSKPFSNNLHLDLPPLFPEPEQPTMSDHSADAARNVIKPPKRFRNSSGSSTPADNTYSPHTNPLTLLPENIGFCNHRINSDKTARRSSIQIDSPTEEEENPLRRCVSYQYIEISDQGSDHKTTSSPSYCPCCNSPRSSDSGMAGSCTLQSPDLPPQYVFCDCQHNSSLNCPSYTDTHGRCSLSTDEINRYKILTGRGGVGNDLRSHCSLSQMGPTDFESQCRCTSPFGSTPRTSCEPSSTLTNILVDSTESTTTSVTSSLDITPLPTPKPWESENQIHRKLTSIRRTQSSKALMHNREDHLRRLESTQQTLQEEPMATATTTTTGVYRSGMYAHWWMKAKLPPSVIVGIRRATHSSSSPVADAGARDEQQRPPVEQCKRSAEKGAHL